MYQPLLPIGFPTSDSNPEPKGVVYTRPWVVEFLLDLSGYSESENLVDLLAIEPAAGEGAFLAPMSVRLVKSCLRQDRPLSDCVRSLIGYELDEDRVVTARQAVVGALRAIEVKESAAEELAAGWVVAGDYLIDAPRLPQVDFVIGNPPYVRLEDIPPGKASFYRNAYPTMRGRADLYIAFFEAGLRQLKAGGLCSFICADRWMLNQYGADLRHLITKGFGVEAVVEMHNANAFDDDVSAYPAITVIRKGKQSRAVVASAGPAVEFTGGASLASALRAAAVGGSDPMPEGLSAATVETWFASSDPWPTSSPARLALLRRLEEHFDPIESDSTRTKVGIGVATGLDKIFITKDSQLVEASRLLPLAMAADTATGQFRWEGHYLVNPWDADGLVDLRDYPLLRLYLEGHRELIKKRNTAQRNPHGWYRTIDRVNAPLIDKAKLYIPDIKDVFNPVLERGGTYPHHNLYFIQSECWNLEVLGGLLLSSIGQLFIEAYGVRMRGGFLRFQAQYLRRIRVPNPDQVSADQAAGLVDAFRLRDRRSATAIALDIYRVAKSEVEGAHRH